ncbi:MAG: hypothetical protein OEQ74_09300 [Gammaproteobacteria bacterium]|nr:hypothetical protein [Gammaproteobacteria bacterium]
MRVLAICIVLLIGTQAQAEDDNFRSCTAIENDAARLSCYDTAADRYMEIEAVTTSPVAAEPPATPTPPATPAPPVVQTERRPPVKIPSSRIPESSHEPAGTGEDGFGLEYTKLKKGETISSRYDGEFTGWSGRTIFRLENGQVWRQAESGRFRASIDRPMLIIERGAFNSYRLRVEGMNRSLRVKRIH